MQWLVRRALPAAAIVLGIATTAVAYQTPSLSGRVTSSDGTPLSGVTVTATPFGSFEAATNPISVTTKSDGSYQFTGLGAGAYSITFVFAGYRTETRDNVRSTDISVLNLTLARRTELTTIYDRDALDRLPTVRDPWGVAGLSPSVALSSINVGGSNSHQPNLQVRGLSTTNTAWQVNGITITDMEAQGSSPKYYAFEALQQVGITTGGADVAVQTPGVTLSLLTRSGTDRFGGSARTWFTNRQLVSSNFSPDLAAQGATLKPSLTLYREYGGEAGGPLVTKKLWWWAGIGEQDATEAPQLVGHIRNDVSITTWSGNAIYRPSTTQRVQFSTEVPDKRTADDTTRQYGFGPTLTGRYDWFLNDRWTLTARGGYVDGGFNIDQAALFSVSGPVDIYSTRRRSFSGETMASGVLTRPNGWNHALKFGAGNLRSNSSDVEGASVDVYPIPVFLNLGPPPFAQSAILYRDSVSGERFGDWHGYAQDAISRGRMTFSAGLRIDYQNDWAP